MIAQIFQQRTAFLLMFFLSALFAGPGRAQVMPLPADQAFHLSASRQPTDTIALRRVIAPGYYLYRDRIKVAASGAAIDAQLSGHAILKDDPTFGSTQIYHDAVVAAVPAVGAMSLFALGIGKGIPLVIFGTFGPQALPKAGRWLVKVKELFGLIFLGLAINMLGPFVPAMMVSVLWGLLAVGAGVWLGALDLIRGRICMSCRVGPEMLGIGVAAYGSILVAAAVGGQLAGVRVPIGTGADGVSATLKERFVAVANATELSQRVAANAGKPSLVYVTADWCVTCAVIDRTVLPDATPRGRLAGFNLVKIDVSNNSPKQQQMMETLRVVGPPTMIFVDPETKEVPASRLVGDISVDTLLASASKAGTVQ